MPERKTPQPPRFVPPPPGSTPVVEKPVKPVEVLTKPARPPRTTPTYGVPIVKPEDAAPATVEESDQTAEIEEADMVAGEIQVQAKEMEVAAPTPSVVVDPTPAPTLVEEEPDALVGERKQGGAGMWMVLGVGGIAILALIAWKVLPGGGEEPPKVARTAGNMAPQKPAVERPAPEPVVMPPPSPATGEAIGGGTMSAATGAGDPAASTPNEAEAPPPVQEAPPAPQEDVQPTAPPPEPEEKPQPKKKKKPRTPSPEPDAGDDPTPAPPKPPPSPKKPSKAAKKEKAKQLLTEARKASMRGEYGKAWRLAKESYGLSRNVATLQVMGVAACKMGDRAKAMQAHRKLPEAKRGSLASVCASNGITLE
jgi:hypothetical protein